MINRLIPLSEGYIYFKDRPISDYPVYEMRWDIGYVLQQIALFPHMSIKENIAQVPQMKKWTATCCRPRPVILMDEPFSADDLIELQRKDKEDYDTC